MSLFRRNLIANSLNKKEEGVKPCIYNSSSVSAKIQIFTDTTGIQKAYLESGEEIDLSNPYVTGVVGDFKVYVIFDPSTSMLMSTFYSIDSLVNISENLFENCASLSSLRDVFSYCTNLKEIPENLFAKNNINNITNCFEFCTSLTSIPSKLFVNNPNIIDCSYCFRGCSNLTGTTPKDLDGKELWERSNKPSGFGCFSGCEKLSNYDNIPTMWKIE